MASKMRTLSTIDMVVVAARFGLKTCQVHGQLTKKWVC